jgi:hypothetical protein
MMLMLSEGKYLGDGVLHLWLTVATLLCVLCYDCHKKHILFYKLLRLITIFYTFRLLFSHFGM